MRNSNDSLLLAFADLVVFYAVLIWCNTTAVILLRDILTVDPHVSIHDISFEPSVLVYKENVDVHLEECPGSPVVPDTPGIIFKSTRVTAEERELLARVVYWEAYSEGPSGMRRVCDVILNRLDSSKFPDNITDIIFSNNQFCSIYREEFYSSCIPSQVYGLVDSEICGQRVDRSSLFFATSPLTQKGLYKYGRHWFSQ